MLLRQCNKVRENIRDGILGAPIGTALAGRSVCLYGLGAVAKSLAKRRKGLEACIADGQLGGVGLDVFWTEPADALDPLLAHPNVIMTPHVAGITDRSLADIARAVAENIERFAVMRPLLNTVD